MLPIIRRPVLRTIKQTHKEQTKTTNEVKAREQQRKWERELLKYRVAASGGGGGHPQCYR